MNPLVKTFSTDDVVRRLMYETLVVIDDDGKVQPQLADSWQVSQDGKTYTFNLRKGVKFHNGQEVTADDAKFAIDYTQNPTNAAYGISKLSSVNRVEVVDTHTIRLHLSEASPAFLSSIATIQAFSVIPKGSLEEGIDKPPAGFPPGTGPFKFIEWQPKQQIVFQRNDDYWGYKAHVDKVVIRPISDATVRLTAARTGDVDMVDRIGYEWIKEILAGNIRGIHPAAAPEASFRTLVFNAADPPFDNLKLRQAIAHGIDKQEWLEAAYFGFGTPATQKYTESHVWFFQDIPTFEKDLAKARTLLKESGYAGQPLVLISEQGQVAEAEAVTFQSQMKAIGVDVKIEVLEFGTYTERMRTGAYGMTFYGGQTDPDPTTTYDRTLRCEEDLQKRASNVTGHCNQEMDALLQQASVELDEEKRRELFKQILTIFHQEVPQVYMAHIPRYFAVRDEVKDFTTDGEGNLMYYGGGLNHAWLDR